MGGFINHQSATLTIIIHWDIYIYIYIYPSPHYYSILALHLEASVSSDRRGLAASDLSFPKHFLDVLSRELPSICILLVRFMLKWTLVLASWSVRIQLLVPASRCYSG